MHAIIKFINNGFLVGCNVSSNKASSKSISIDVNTQLRNYDVNQLFVNGGRLGSNIYIYTQPTNGTASLSGSTLDYTPNMNYVGTDSLVIRLSDAAYGRGWTDSILTITIKKTFIVYLYK